MNTLAASISTRNLRRFALALCFAAALSSHAPSAQAQASPTAFTYQGRISLNNAAYSGSADVRFQVFDAELVGNAVTPPLTALNVQVVSGLFTTTLDFGVPVAAFPERWIELTVTTPSGGANVQTLSPRQQVRAGPASAVAFAVPVFSGESIVPFKGMVRFNDLLNDFQGFNGFFWVSLTGKPNAAYASATYVADDTFTVPTGVTRLFIESWGGGGGGGGVVNVTPNCGTAGATSGIAGGSGGYAATLVDVTPGEQFTVTVGQRGNLGANTVNILTSGFDGTAGGTTTVSRAGNTLMTATGGQGGAGAGWSAWATDCANGPNDFILRTGGEGGAATGGNIANITGPSASQRSGKPNFCFGCCVSGLAAPTPVPVGSVLAQMGLPGAVSAGAGGAGTAAIGPFVGVSCVNGGQPADNGNHGEVRFYWTTAP